MNNVIPWTEKTWNPVRGCSMAPGSEDGGCLFCYAARMAARNLPELKSPTTGSPFAILRNTGRIKNGRPERVPRWTGDVELIEKALAKPMHWRKPRRVFVNSMSDLFHEKLPEADILSVFDVMGKCPAHTFQILTKRQARLREVLEGRYWRNLGYSPAMGGDHYVRLERRPNHSLVYDQADAPSRPQGTHVRNTDLPFLPNVWLGVSIENPATARLRILDLLLTPAARRFVSYEPALDEVNLRWALLGRSKGSDTLPRSFIAPQPRRLDWVIIGGESGPGARPFHLAWLRSMIEQCRDAKVPLFVKQLGARPIAQKPSDQTWLDRITDLKGENMKEWPPDVRIRQYPKPWRLAA